MMPVLTHLQNNFIIGQVTPDMLAHMKWGTYVFFGIFTTLGAFFILFFVPETKQLSLGTSSAAPTLFGDTNP